MKQSWVGNQIMLSVPSKQRPQKYFPSYKSVKIKDAEGNEFITSVGDFVRMKGAGAEFVARILQLYEDNSKMQATVMWMRRSKDLPFYVDQDHADELFFSASSHTLENPVHTILGNTRVQFQTKNKSMVYDPASETTPDLNNSCKIYVCNREIVDPKRLVYFDEARLQSLIEELKLVKFVEPIVPESSKRVKTNPPPLPPPPLATPPLALFSPPPSSMTSSAPASIPTVPPPSEAIKLKKTQSSKKEPNDDIRLNQDDSNTTMESIFACFQSWKQNSTSSIPSFSIVLEILGFLVLAQRVHTSCMVWIRMPLFLFDFATNRLVLPHVLKAWNLLCPAFDFDVIQSVQTDQDGIDTLTYLEKYYPGTIFAQLAKSCFMPPSEVDSKTWFFPVPNGKDVVVFSTLLLRGDGFRTCVTRFMGQNLILPLVEYRGEEDTVRDLVRRSFQRLLFGEFAFGMRREGDFLFGIYPAPQEKCPCLMVKLASGRVSTFYVPHNPRLGFIKALIFAKEKVEPRFQTLVLGGEVQEPDELLLQDLQDNCVIHLVVTSG